MRAHLITTEAQIRGSGVDIFGVLLRPEPFIIQLVGAPDGVKWFVENDPVLDHREAPDGKSSQIIATGVGTSIINLEVDRGRSVLLKRLIVTVFELDDPTVSVDFSFENIRDVDQP